MSAAKEIPELMSAAECAKYCGVSERNFKERTSKQVGFPAPIKIGNVRQWVKSEFSEWFMRQRES
jgi:predicted DNA-binding transcriptional regulator AlpA